MNAKLGVALGSIAVALGCSTSAEYRRAPQAMLETVDVQIRAEDGSFTLTPGQAAPTPFQSEDCPLTPAPGNYEQAIRGGARAVRIQYPGIEEPLYGLLSFCPMPADSTAPPTRMALVQVPQSYVDSTDGGRVAVVFEQLYHPPRTEQQRQSRAWPAWVLYLSRQPFPTAAVAPSRSNSGGRVLGGSLE